MSDLRSVRHAELRTCESTQEEVRKLLNGLESNDHDLHWIATAVQTKGRGRQGSVWQTSPETSAQLLTSVGFKNPDFDALGPLLSLVAGHALFLAVSKLSILDGAEFFLKWPNDLYAIHSAHQKYPSKVAGILAERRANQGTIIGFGINLSWHPNLPDRETGFVASYIRDSDHSTLRNKLFSALEESLLAILKKYLKNPTAFIASFTQELQQSSMRTFLQVAEITISGQRVKPLSLNRDGSLEAINLQNQTPITLR